MESVDSRTLQPSYTDNPIGSIQSSPPNEETEWRIDSKEKLDALTKPFFDRKKDETSPSPSPPTSITIPSSYATEENDGVKEIAEKLKNASVPLPSLFFELDKGKVINLGKDAGNTEDPENASYTPLPNPRIHLPAGISAWALIGKESKKNDNKIKWYEKAPEGSADFYKSLWFTRKINSADKEPYMGTYGVEKQIDLPRKHLIDQERKGQSPQSGCTRRYICYATGMIYNVNRSLQVDHVFPKNGDKSIHSRIFKLFKKVNENEQFRGKLFSVFGCFKKRWVFQQENQYSPTQHMIRDYFNDIGNLALIYSVENGIKSNEDPGQFLERSPFYSELLLEIEKRFIIFRIRRGSELIGLGTAIYEFFHVNYDWYLRLSELQFEISNVLIKKSYALLKAKKTYEDAEKSYEDTKKSCEDAERKNSDYAQKQLVIAAKEVYDNSKKEFDEWKDNAEGHRRAILGISNMDSRTTSFCNISFEEEEELKSAILGACNFASSDPQDAPSF